MSEQADEQCEKCGGQGYIDVEEGDPEYERLEEKYGAFASAYTSTLKRRCDCKKREKFRERVGEEIYRADRLDDSDFADLTDENLFITSDRETFLPHLRFALASEGLSFFFRQTTDAQMRDVFVGESDEFDSLSQVALGPDLLIIYLAVLTYENAAMPGILEETLRMRRHDDSPTWVVNPPRAPFDKSHEAYSQSLDLYIDKYFTRVDLSDESPIDYESDPDDEIEDIASDVF